MAMRIVRLTLLGCAMAVGLGIRAASAQTAEIDDVQHRIQSGADVKQGLNVLVVPLPVVDPAIGNGLTLVTALFYSPVQGGRPWVTGGGAMRTSHDNKAFGVAQQADLLNGRLRLVGFAGHGDFNLEFFGIGAAAGATGRSVVLNQKGDIGMVNGLYRVAGPFYAGLRFRYIRVSSSLAEPLQADHPALPQDFGLERTTSGLGPAFEYDTRNQQFTPSRGIYAQGQWLIDGSSLGSDYTYEKFNLAVNAYRPLNPKTVLAVRGSLCSASREAPFFNMCFFGSQNDLRGYQGGQYRDHAMVATQVELRRHLFWRVGGVAFGGVGAVAPGLGDFGNAKGLPAGGLGLRFQPKRNVPVNLSVDYAWGRDSQGVYVYVGEAF